MSGANKARRGKAATTPGAIAPIGSGDVVPPRFVETAQPFQSLYERMQREAPSPLQRMADGVAVAEALVGRRIALLAELDCQRFRDRALDLCRAYRRGRNGDDEEQAEADAKLDELGELLERGADEADALRELSRDLPVYHRAVDTHATHLARVEKTFAAEDVLAVLRELYAVVEAGSAKAPRLPKAVLAVIQSFAARRADAIGRG